MCIESKILVQVYQVLRAFIELYLFVRLSLLYQVLLIVMDLIDFIASFLLNETLPNTLNYSQCAKYS
jgi:hypothetical protein